MQLRILGVNDMLEAGSTAPFSALINNGWTMRWQVKEFCGWKNVTLEDNQTLLNKFTAPNALEEWQHPRLAVVDGRRDDNEQLNECSAPNALEEWQHPRLAVFDGHRDDNAQLLRLVALREWCNS